MYFLSLREGRGGEGQLHSKKCCLCVVISSENDVVSLQVIDALIDQRLHGVRGATPGSTSSIVHDVLQQHSPFTFAQGTNPHARSASVEPHATMFVIHQ